MKRLAEECSGPTTRRKAARLKALPSLSRQHSFDCYYRDQLGLGEAQRLCTLYNSFFDIGNHHVVHDIAVETAIQGKQFQDAVQRIAQIAERARQDAQQVCDEMRTHLADFVTSTADESSYEGGNVLSLDFSVLRGFVDRLVIKDSEHFRNYVFRSIRESMETNPTEEEEQQTDNDWAEHNKRRRATDREENEVGCSEQRKEWYQMPSFLSKALILVNRMISEYEIVSAFHALVLLKTAYRESNRRVGFTMLAKAHETIDKWIRALVDYEVPESAKRCTHCEVSDAEHGNEYHDIEICYDGLIWPPDAVIDTGTSNFDFPSAARTLRTEYFDTSLKKKECGGHDRLYFDDGHAFCFHQGSSNLLDWLQKKAYAEVSAKVIIFTQPKFRTKLSWQLTHTIHEETLRREDLPCDPSIHETRMVEAPKWYLNNIGQTEAPARPYTGLKDLYSCPGMVTARCPESVFIEKPPAKAFSPHDYGTVGYESEIDDESDDPW